MSTTDLEANVDGSGHSVRGRAFPTSSMAPETLDRTRNLRKAFICLCFVDLVSFFPEDRKTARCGIGILILQLFSLQQNQKIRVRARKARKYLRRLRS